MRLVRVEQEQQRKANKQKSSDDFQRPAAITSLASTISPAFVAADAASLQRLKESAEGEGAMRESAIGLLPL